MSNINNRIAELKNSLTGNFLEDMDIQQEIRNLERELKGDEPITVSCSLDDDQGCEMCGS